MRSALPALCLAFVAVGCGGSSSETPPPLEPDPTSSRYTGPRIPGPEEERAAPVAEEPEPAEARPDPTSKPARATWGSGKPLPPTPPAMTSPNALPAPSSSPR